jgi:hypothetical protein
MSGSVNSVQARIKERFPFAHCIHSYAHQLKVVTEEAASQNVSEGDFLHPVCVSRIFSRSPQSVRAGLAQAL